jgi:hypothetical protein
VFALNELLEADSQGRVPGSYQLGDCCKAELAFEHACLGRRPCRFNGGKAYFADGNKIVQISLSKLKSDASFGFESEVTAIESFEQEVVCELG